MKNEIRMTYPRTEYFSLNQELTSYIGSKLTEFMEYSTVTIQPDFPYTLDTYYEKYSSGDYLSYVFFTSQYTGGAHPSNTIYTITYDKEKNKLITISDLIDKNKDLLSILSKESREILKKYPTFQTPYFIENMLLEGTEPKMDSFQNFAFGKDGLILFFEQYQVEPYSEGSFRVVIPYDKLTRFNLISN